ncbi:MAG: bifunctional diguanylate cyclase/phosphodiesterase [Sinobacteraceae bacterium]|nr:bifunctional diguanylate cyclase/phosphodiesterase [Nevskiaceae bacterium]
MLRPVWMTSPSNKNDGAADPWGSFEPYVQLVRSLLPRAASVALFDAPGKMRWSSETTTVSDFRSLVEDALDACGRNPQGPGLMRMLDGSLPVYLCWLRDDAEQLIGIVAVACRQSNEPSTESRGFSFVHSLLRPVLECLRRDLVSRAAIEQLTRTVSARDRDLELLLADGTADRPAGDGADELKSILQQAMEHVVCAMAALIVPDKSIALLRSSTQRPADMQLVARAHRHLLSMAQIRREPLIANKLAPNSAMGILPYKTLSCALRSGGGKAMGVLALFREDLGQPFGDREARLTEILARKAVGIIESSYDALSGLYTRPAFEQRVRAVVGDANGPKHWSALYMDADQLHVINDNFGMHVGDSVLGQLGELIRNRMPAGAFASRISGDRFAALLPTQLDDAEKFAESLREGVEQLGATHGESRVHISVSIGVAPLDTAPGELMHSLAAAETACKAAKDRGRNRVEAYKSNDVSLVRRFADINIAGQLRAAIDAGRLQLHSQLILPFACAESPRPHFELLLRMVDEDGRTVGPDRFLSAANRYQLMPEIDRWVINRSIELLKPQAALLSGHAVTFAINFSGQSLNDEEFADFLLERIGSSGLDPSVFCFELTENATIASIARAESLIRRLRALGCGVALDDFGTGLSSLAYLRQLPVTMLKIDGSFVRDILKDPRAESMVRAIAQLARSMSLSTVAEYVETEEIRTRVATLGVDYGQGFAIGRPTPLADLLSELPLLLSTDSMPTVISEFALEQLVEIVH